MKTKPSAWMPLYVGDYLRDTAHLSTSEHGAYFLMLMHAWTHGGELPGDGPRLCIITKMSAKDWRHSGDILMAFFQRHGAMLRHKRLDLELANATTLTERRRTAGRLSAEARGRHRQNGETPPSPENKEEKMNISRKQSDRAENIPNVKLCERSANGQQTVSKTREKREQNARPSPSPSPRKKEKRAGLRPVVTLAGDRHGTDPPANRSRSGGNRDETEAVAELVLRPPDAPAARAGPGPTAILEWAVGVWNRVCGGRLSPVVKITNARRDAFLRRWRDDFAEDAQAWERFCERVAASPFLTDAEGKNRARWRANFDFVLEPRTSAHRGRPLGPRRRPGKSRSVGDLRRNAGRTRTRLRPGDDRDEHGAFRPRTH